MQTIWKVVGASVLGASHLKSNTPCQDANAYTLLENGLLVIAVSDGAGSAPCSDQGSSLAVQAAASHLYRALTTSIPETRRKWGELLYQTFTHTRQAVLDLALQGGRDPREFACTLTLLIADHEWLITGQLGDGLAVVQTADGALHAAAAPQRGEYADSTFFLTSPNAEEKFWGEVLYQGADLPPVTALAVMTDGLTNLAIEKASGEPHAPFFAPLLGFPARMDNHAAALAELSAFLNTDRINSRTDDDKTLVLAARPGTPPVE
jgi:hypothetical protein